MEGRPSFFEMESVKEFCSPSLLSYMWLGPDDLSLWIYMTMIGQQQVNGLAIEFLRFDMDYVLRYQFIIYFDILQFFNRRYI